MIAFFTSNIVQSIVAFQLTGENGSVGFVVFGRGAAQLLLGPVGGALADRLPKKAILLSCQSITMVVFLVLAALSSSGSLTVTHLVVGGFIVGLTFAFLGPTRTAYMVDLVEFEHRGRAAALTQVALNASRVIGPAFAGVLLAIETVGATGAFLVMAGFYALALALHATVPPSSPEPAQPGAPRRAVLGDILEGIRYVRSSPRLRTLVALFVLTIMLGLPYVSVLPGLVEHQLHLPSAQVSVLYGASAAGGLLASLSMTALADSPHALGVYRAGGICFGLCLMLLWSVETLPMAAALMAVCGFGSGCMTTLNGAVLLRSTDARYMGRVMSLSMLAYGAYGLVAVPVGFAADAFGEGLTLAVLGGLVVAIVSSLGFVLVRTPEPQLEAV